MFDPVNEPALRLDVAGLLQPLEVLTFSGQEAIGQPFVYELELLLDDPALDLASLRYRSAFLHIGAAGKGIHGQLHELVQQEHGPGPRRCHVRLQPQLSSLSQRHSQRMFSSSSVPQILSQVLKEHGIAEEDRRFELRLDYPLRDFCTQYRESDLQFLQRLCAQAGIHYYFEHRKRGHCLVFVEANECTQTPVAQVTPRMHSPQRAWVVDVDEARPDPSRPLAVQFDWLYQGEGATPCHCWLPLSEELCSDSVLQLIEGSEVLVSFIDGDPDRPMITGFLHTATMQQVAVADEPAFTNGMVEQLRSSEPLLVLCMLPGGGSFNHCAQPLCTCRVAMRFGSSGLA
ncbi:contractile injection system protein, VgrG/Pvc8 family [Pseudomonas sp. LB3P31]